MMFEQCYLCGWTKITHPIQDGITQHLQLLAQSMLQNSKTLLYPNPFPSKSTEPKTTTPHLNIPTKGHDDTDKSKTNDTNNLLAQLDKQHPRFQELVNINDISCKTQILIHP